MAYLDSHTLLQPDSVKKKISVLVRRFLGHCFFVYPLDTSYCQAGDPRLLNVYMNNYLKQVCTILDQMQFPEQDSPQESKLTTKYHPQC